MSRQSPKRPASSRAPVSRPRRVAGQGGAPTETQAPPVDLTKAPAEAPPVEPVETTAAEAPTAAPPVEPGETTAAEAPAAAPPVEPVETTAAEAPAEASDQRAGLAALFDSSRATTVLISLVAVLALAAGGLFAWDALRDDDPAKPSEQPVVIGNDDATAAVDVAAKAAETIVGTSYEDYDDQVDEAAGLMTEAFAEEYRQTAADTRSDVVDAKAVVDARVVAQGVVHATRTEVQALVFLNQYVSKDGGDTTYTPYRLLVTVVHTDRGWLVSDLDTK